jgi:hypothetical protein
MDLLDPHCHDPCCAPGNNKVQEMSICSTGLSHDELRGARPLTVTVAMTKKLSGLGNTTIWALIKTRKLKSISVGRRRLIVFDSLQKLLSADPATGAP